MIYLDEDQESSPKKRLGCTTLPAVPNPCRYMIWYLRSWHRKSPRERPNCNRLQPSPVFYPRTCCWWSSWRPARCSPRCHPSPAPMPCWVWACVVWTFDDMARGQNDQPPNGSKWMVSLLTITLFGTIILTHTHIWICLLVQNSIDQVLISDVILRHRPWNHHYISKSATVILY